MQSAWFRPHNRSEDVSTLYLAGAGTHPGAGIPGVISSGKIVADLVERDCASSASADAVRHATQNATPIDKRPVGRASGVPV